ncbi:hypothetical protein ACFSSE_09910, partial [Pedobacter alpinus]
LALRGNEREGSSLKNKSKKVTTVKKARNNSHRDPSTPLRVTWWMGRQCGVTGVLLLLAVFL